MKKTVTYVAEGRHYGCIDDGGIGHDTTRYKATWPLRDAKNDKEARLMAGDLAIKFQKDGPKCCHPGPSVILGIKKTVTEEAEDGLTRTKTYSLTLPTVQRCPCGKKYTPLRDERPCHSIVKN